MIVEKFLSINNRRHTLIEIQSKENIMTTEYEPILANNSKTKIKITFYENSLINL